MSEKTQLYDDALHGLYNRICEFVRKYGGAPPASSDPDSLKLLYDYALVLNAEFNIIIKQKEGEK